MNVLESIMHRYATKKFDSTKKIPDDVLAVCTKILQYAPSSFGVQPWKFLIVGNPALKARLEQASRGQQQVQDCSHLVVFLANTQIDEQYVKQYTTLIEEKRDKPAGSVRENRQKAGKVERIVHHFSFAYAAPKECFLALGFLLAEVTHLGIDACPLGGIDPHAYDELLDLSARGYKTVVACALGYRSDDDAYATLPKVRFPEQDILERR